MKAVRFGIVGLWLSFSASCAHYPPPAMPFDGVAPEARGTTSVRGYGGTLMNPFNGGAAGGGVRAGHQLTPEVSLSLDGAAAAGANGQTYAARLGARYSFAGGKLALSAGLGGEIANSTYASESDRIEIRPWVAKMLSEDVGIRAGTLLADHFEPYVGVTLSIVHWFDGTRLLAMKDGSAGFAVADVGVNVRVTTRWRVGVDVMVCLATANLLGQQGLIGGPYLVSPTMNVGYVFGGEGL